MVVFREKWLNLGKSGCIRTKVVVFGQMRFYSVKIGCTKGQNICIKGKVVVIGQTACIRAKVVVFCQKWLYSQKVVVFGQSGCVRAKVVVLAGKVVVFGRK